LISYLLFQVKKRTLNLAGLLSMPYVVDSKVINLIRGCEVVSSLMVKIGHMPVLIVDSKLGLP
jgi:uncharacterized protein YvpB